MNRPPLLFLLLSLLTVPPAPAQTTDLTGWTPSVQEIVDALAGPAGVHTKGLTRGIGDGAVTRDIRLEPRRIRLDVPFANNATQPSADAVRLLDNLAAALADPALAGRSIRIDAHANRTGTQTYNQILTESRAGNIAWHLARRGVDSPRLETLAHGFRQPLPGLDPRDGRNRRVEIEAL